MHKPKDRTKGRDGLPESSRHETPAWSPEGSPSDSESERSLATIRLCLPADLAYRELATRAVETACNVVRADVASVPQDFSHEVVSALGEAFNNIVIHGYKDRPRGEVRLDFRSYADRLELELRDSGASFEPDVVPAPDMDCLPESGMGLFIIRTCVDELIYEPGPPNRMVLVKHFTHERAAVRQAVGCFEMDTKAAERDEGRSLDAHSLDWQDVRREGKPAVASRQVERERTPRVFPKVAHMRSNNDVRQRGTHRSATSSPPPAGKS